MFKKKAASGNPAAQVSEWLTRALMALPKGQQDRIRIAEMTGGIEVVVEMKLIPAPVTAVAYIDYLKPTRQRVEFARMGSHEQ